MTDHVTRDFSDPKKWVGVCQHCGDRLEIGLFCGGSILSSATFKFCKLHKKCEAKTFVGYSYSCPKAHHLFRRDPSNRLEVIGHHFCEECQTKYDYSELVETDFTAND